MTTLLGKLGLQRRHRKFVTGTAFGVAVALLFIGALVMLFPILWMFTASLKPEWQILAQPPIWIPSRWIHVQAGNTAPDGV